MSLAGSVPVPSSVVSADMDPESINGPCVITLISAGRRTARDLHGPRLYEL